MQIAVRSFDILNTSTGEMIKAPDDTPGASASSKGESLETSVESVSVHTTPSTTRARCMLHSWAVDGPVRCNQELRI